MNLKQLLADSKITGRGKNNKLKLLLGLAAFGILLILLGSLGTGSTQRAKAVEPRVDQQKGLEVGDSMQDCGLAMDKEEEYLSKRLEKMLSEIDGAGSVGVTISLGSSTISEYAINDVVNTKTTREQDQSGGTRVVTEDSENKQVVLVQSQGGQAPLIKHSSGPDIAGVLVVAEGATDPRVKARLFDASCVALGVSPHKIMVVTKRGEKSANNN